MRRLSLMFSLFLVAALLTGPVLASETDYCFDLMPSVSFLPTFEVEVEGEAYFRLDGSLPEGNYTAALYFPADGVTIEFPDTFCVIYDAQWDDYPACMLDASLVIEGEVIPCKILFVDVNDEGWTMAVFLSLDGGTPEFSTGDAFILESLAASDDSTGDSTLKEIIVDLFGPYEQQTETITQTLADGSTVSVEHRIPGIAGLDYEWLASVGLFALALLSFFRILGGLIKQ